MGTAISTKVNGISREEFGAMELARQSETASTSVAAREQAAIQARCIMSERHPRIWESVRVRLLAHCERPRFAEVARYSKPTGKKQINGEWKDVFAEGLSARFAEVARQEMGNTEATSSVVFEDDLLRIIRAGVSDIERNSHEFRELAIAKAVEKKGRKNRKTDEWEPPEGREIIGSPRLNSYGDPVWLVKATDDEVQIRQNSGISKIQRDATLRLIPKDIRDECEDRCIATLNDPNKTDPEEIRKRIMDSFAKLGVMPEDLMNYMSSPLSKVGPVGWNELRTLGVAIRDGETTFAEAMQRKFSPGDGAVPEGEESKPARDERLRKQMEDQLAAAKAKYVEPEVEVQSAPKPARKAKPAAGEEIPTLGYLPMPDTYEVGAKIRVSGAIYFLNGDGFWTKE